MLKTYVSCVKEKKKQENITVVGIVPISLTLLFIFFFMKMLCVFSNLKEFYPRVRRFCTILKQPLESVEQYRFR